MLLDEIVLIVYIFSLSVLTLFASHGFIMIYYRRKYGFTKPKLRKDFQAPMVTVQIPLYNELYVAERIINAVCSMDYPKNKIEIQVLDDSTDETVDLVQNIILKKKAEGFDIVHLQRTKRSGYKAGALKEGLVCAKGKYIAIFDADFIPRINFLRETLQYFYQSDVGMVQTRWEHLNEDFSMLTRVQALALNGHFVIEQTVRNQAGFFINFNGTGGVWRKDCILDAGNWNGDTLTEDLDLSYRAQMKGWKFVFLRDFTTPAELPSEMNALKAQQFRWTKGAIETAKKILPLLWASHLPMRVKLQSTFHLTNNLVFPFILLAGVLNVPLIFIKNSGPWDSIFNFMAIFVLAFISSFLFYMYAQKEVYSDWRKKILLFPVFMAGSMGMSVNNTRAVIEGLMNRKSEFVRTPKFKIDNSNSKIRKNIYLKTIKTDPSTLVEFILSIYCFIGVAASVYFLEIAAIPFQVMFFAGFGLVSFFSFKNKYFKEKA